MANAKLSSYPSVTLTTGTLVGLQSGANVQYPAASVALNADNLANLADAPTAVSNLGLANSATIAASSTQTYLAAVLGAVTSGDIAIFSDANGTVTDSGITPSNAAKAKLASVNSAVTVGNAAVYTDTSGTIGQSAAMLNTVTTASATPGTLRSFVGQMTSSATTQTSGNLVGVRGAVTMVGASGGFAYGVQGKIIPSGTLSGSVWAPAVFGQYDLSASTINAGQIAALWGDMGASAGTLTDVTGVRGIALTNTIAALTMNAMDYRYGKASNLFELAGDAGTYITAGAATPSGDMKKIAITIDGVKHYILAAAVWS